MPGIGRREFDPPPGKVVDAKTGVLFGSDKQLPAVPVKAMLGAQASSVSRNKGALTLMRVAGKARAIA